MPIQDLVICRKGDPPPKADALATFRSRGILPVEQPQWCVPNRQDRVRASVERVALLVMNPRNITVCVESIRSLPVDKFWFRGFYETQLVPAIAQAVADTDYDAYFIVSDDARVNRPAFRLLRQAIKVYPAVTGWCNLSPDVPIANVSVAPLESHFPVLSAYHCPSAESVRLAPRVFRTWWIGFALSGMRRELWERFPFNVYPMARTAIPGQPYPWGHNPDRDGTTWDGGQASDYHLSRRLQAAEVKVWCMRDAYAEHLKNDAHPTPLQIGDRPPEVVFEPWRSP